MSRTILHKHHIIPKHAGGTDDPSNLIYLTVEEHEAKSLLSIHARNRKKITCSCGKTVDIANHGRWHKNCSL